MKKISLNIFLLLVFTIVSSKLYSQVTNPNNTYSSGAYVGWSSTNDLIFKNSTQRMVIKSSGNVGIGATAPTSLLHQFIGSATLNYHQFGNTSTGSAGTDGLLIGIDASGNGAITQQEQLPILFSTHNGTNVAERMRLSNTGNLGIGTTNPTEKFQVNSGNLLVKGTNNFSGSGHEAILYMGDNTHYI